MIILPAQYRRSSVENVNKPTKIHTRPGKNEKRIGNRSESAEKSDKHRNSIFQRAIEITNRSKHCPIFSTGQLRSHANCINFLEKMVRI